MSKQINKSKLKPIKKTVTTKVSGSKKIITTQRKYQVNKNNHVDSLKKMGMNDDNISVVNKLLENSENVFVVGGAVRDVILGKKPHDFDIATDLKPVDIMKIFGEKSSKLTENVFPTVRVKHGNSEMEISTFRKEISTGVGDRNAVKVEHSDNIKDDLKRRDLTINALAINAKTGELVDPFGGKKDIKNKTIRFVENATERIKEDPLRYLRAIRFKLRIDGNYSEDTRKALASNEVKNLVLNNVSGERVKEELLKGVQSVEHFSGFFKDLNEFDMLNDLFPEVHKMVNHDGGPQHGEDVFTHCMLAGDNYGVVNPDDKKDVLGKFAAYLHDFGKPLTYNPENRSFLGHDSIGAEKIQGFLDKFRFSKEETKFIQQLIKNHMRKPTTPKGARRMITEIDGNVPYLMKIFKADSISNLRKSPDEIKHTISIINGINVLVDNVSKEKSDFEKIAINGNDIMDELNVKAGPHLKVMLEYAKDLVLEDPKLNNRDVLIQKVNERFFSTKDSSNFFKYIKSHKNIVKQLHPIEYMKVLYEK